MEGAFDTILPFLPLDKTLLSTRVRADVRVDVETCCMSRINGRVYASAFQHPELLRLLSASHDFSNADRIYRARRLLQLRGARYPINEIVSASGIATGAERIRTSISLSSAIFIYSFPCHGVPYLKLEHRV